MAFEIASSVVSMGARSGELGEILRAKVNDAPVLAALAIGARQDLVGVRGGRAWWACNRWA